MTGSVDFSRLKRLGNVAWQAVLRGLLPVRCGGCGAIGDVPHALCADCWAALRFVAPPFCACCGYPFELMPPEMLSPDYRDDEDVDDEDVDDDVGNDAIFGAAGHLAERHGAGRPGPSSNAQHAGQKAGVNYGRGALCGPCLRHIPPYDRARAALIYDDGSRDYVLRYKHGDRTDLTPLLARWMMQAGQDYWRDANLLVPVPLHRSRLLMRRYNQSGLLAAALSRQTGIEFAPDLITRKRKTRSLAGLGRASRQREVQGAFAVSDRRAAKYRLDGAKVVLVDDVLTTGATAAACARALKRAGAMQVDLITIARVVR
ncbi:ComF family protein [Thalassospira marina]|nr:ComF family protein [Thalassospira marina]